MVRKLRLSLLAVALMVFSVSGFAQGSKKSAGNNWHLKDRKDGYYGISLDKAYELVKGKKSETIIVAVIDSGIDTTHEDLRPIFWVNAKEIPGNGIDDDGNGYIDDVHGWNFIGGRDGRNVKQDSYEAARFYHMYKEKFLDLSNAAGLSAADQKLYKDWLRAREDINKGMDPNELFFLKRLYPVLVKGDSIIAADLKKKEYNGHDLKNYKATHPDAVATREIILNICEGNNGNYDITNRQIIDDIEGELRKAEAADAPPRDYRGEIVKDNPNDINDRFYGNNDIMANTPLHGTHVSGIIGAVRNNGKGGDGVANNVRLMTIRAVPDGDEHDKDIALAIRYAVDNGAKIINMSFGKYYSPQKHWVDEALIYAESKGVLLVAAAGNEGFNADTMPHFPHPILDNGKKVNNWIMVGASGDPSNGGLVASFSNYGKKEVDVFAPGVNIYSTIPGGNTYGNLSGTSMASPVTAGLAAFIWSYFPTLTAQQVKHVIEKSAVPADIKVTKPKSGEKVDLSDISKTGGLINAFEAVKLASQLTGQTIKTPEPVKTKMKVKKKKKS
ncbi:MAG: S8 family serine peptidase [Flavisolibacter sp.]|nr:S8 family serine peptidase [Flavisolibacter sp.]